MSRHDTPGTIVIGGNIVQQPDDKGGIQGGLGQAALNIPVDQPAQTAAEAKAAVEAKKEDIKNLTGDPRSLAIQKNIQNQQLNNLLIQQAQAEARERILSQATPSQVDVDQGFGIVPTLRKADLTGFEGGPFGLNIPAFGATPSTGMSGVRTLKNPLTGELLFSTDPENLGSRQDELLKARLGLTTPQYNDFISKLYDANPELFEETFPVASGNLAQPILARLLEGGFGKVGQGIGSFVDSATGAIFKPRGGTVRPSDVGTPSDTGGVTSVIDAPKLETPLFANVPDQFREGFLKFYNEYEGPKVGGMAITPVTLPDGSVIEFGDTGSARIFREYLESIGVDSNLQNQTFKIVEDTPQPTGITGFDVDKFYASLPQFQQSYSQQGVSPSLLQFLETAQRFPTV